MSSKIESFRDGSALHSKGGFWDTIDGTLGGCNGGSYSFSLVVIESDGELRGDSLMLNRFWPGDNGTSSPLER